MADQLWINGTQVHPQVAMTYGSISVVSLDWGTPDTETFLDPRPLADGMVFRGQVTKDRRFTLVLNVDGVGSLAKGQDTWEDVLDIINASNGLVNYKYVRDGGGGGTVTRQLMALATSEPAWTWVRGGGMGTPGLRPNGNVVVELPCVAPYPWWRNATDTDETITTSGTTPANKVLTRSGMLPVGLLVKVSTTGSLAEMTVSDGVRTMVLSATFNGTPKGVDWYYTDPTATSIDSGVTISTTSHLSLHSASTTITITPGAGSTGDHTVALSWYPAWKTP